MMDGQFITLKNRKRHLWDGDDAELDAIQKENELAIARGECRRVAYMGHKTHTKNQRFSFAFEMHAHGELRDLYYKSRIAQALTLPHSPKAQFRILQA